MSPLGKAGGLTDPLTCTAVLLDDTSSCVGYALAIHGELFLTVADLPQAAMNTGRSTTFVMLRTSNGSVRLAYPRRAEGSDLLLLEASAHPGAGTAVAEVCAPVLGAHRLFVPDPEGGAYLDFGLRTVMGEHGNWSIETDQLPSPAAGMPMWSATQGCFIGFAGPATDGTCQLIAPIAQGGDDPLILAASYTGELEVLRRRVARLEEQLARVERLAVLPNYKIPSVASLARLGELDIRGKRVLVKLDLDIPGGTVDRNHFKYERAARSINAVLAGGASQCLLLASQGVSAVEEFEEASEDLAPHVESLSSRVAGVELVFVDDLRRLSADDQLVMLPNVMRISSTERAILASDSIKSRRPDTAVEVAINSDLREKLAGAYDVFVLDDFRSTVVALPSNVGLAQAPEIAIGLGLEHDLVTLERLVERCIRLGVASTNIRLCLAGSSRPDSLEIVETFLQRQLFDVCLVGPMTDVLLLHAEGADLAPSLIKVVDRLARASGTHLADLRAGAARRIVDNYPSRLLRPVDFVVRDARDPSRSRRVGRDELGQLNRHEGIASIGPSTLEAYRERIEGASLVFHFGMMGSSDANDVAMTQDIIRAYAEVGVESFMAGDHIVELANDLGLLGRDHSSLSAVTGADTTTFYMTGESLPGLAPFSNRSDGRG